jgi:MSHA biogenesis protein MshJ
VNAPPPVVQALQPLSDRLKPLAERIDRLSIRERALVFGAALILIYVTWQLLLMDPLAARVRLAEQRLVDAEQLASAASVAGTAADRDPAVLAASRERALRERLAALDTELSDASSGYVPPERMSALLRELLHRQQGLRLVSLRNLPVESLARADGDTASGAPAATSTATATDAAHLAAERGPFLHPVEIIIEGDYASLVAYVRALEALPWRLHWRQLDLNGRSYPVNRVRIEIGTLSLSREWLSV